MIPGKMSETVDAVWSTKTGNSHPVPRISTNQHASSAKQQFDRPLLNTKSTNLDDKVVIKRRSSRKVQDSERTILSRTKYLELKKEFVPLYLDANPNEVAKLQICNDLISYDVRIPSKYQELNLQDLLDKNKVRKQINFLTQTLGILEKYASNLIKPNRPTFWRQVKFTSNLVKTYLENVVGSYDILKQMGYTKTIPDGLSFPEDVVSPNVEKVQMLAAELFLAKYEIDELVNGRHPFLEIKFPPTGSSSGKLQEATVSDGSDGSESEYEDAEDGLPTATGSTVLPSKAISAVPMAKPPTPTDDKQCHVCGENTVTFSCKECDEFFCADCVIKFHSNRKRQHHTVKEIVNNFVGDHGSQQQRLESHIAGKPALLPSQQATKKVVKRPVPAPRKKILIDMKTPEIKRTAPSMLYHPLADVISTNVPAFRSRSTQYSPPNPKISSRESILQQAITQKEREIKRPPPFDEPKKLIGKVLSDESIYESLKMPSEHLYETLDHLRGGAENMEIVPPPLPPRKPTSQPAVMACPHCFCINEGNVTKCVACGTPLTGNQQSQPGKSSQTLDVTEQILKYNQSEQPRRAHSSPLPGKSTVILQANQTYGLPFTKAEHQSSSSMPSTVPGHKSLKWQCKHCTFHNDMSTRICGMCAKTTDDPVEIISGSPTALPTKFSDLKTSPSFSQFSDQIPAPVTSSSVHLNYLTSTSNSPLPPGSTTPSSFTMRQEEAVFPSEYVKLQQQEEEYLLRNFQKTAIQSPEVPSPDVPFSGRASLGRHNPASPGVQYTGLTSPHKSSPLLPSVARISSLLASQEPLSRPGGEDSVSVTEYFETEQIKQDGLQFIKHLKEAETQGFSPEELNIAYHYYEADGSMSPIHWLETKWFDRIHEVMIEFTNKSKDENYGNISPEEAREAIIEHTGRVAEATQKCITDRKEKLNEVMKSGIYIRTDVIKALDVNDGNVEDAIQHLQRMTFEPMLQRIKDSCLEDNVDNIALPQVSRQISASQDDEIFEAIVSNKEIDMDRRVRVMFAEKSLVSWGRALTAIKLIDMDKFTVLDSIEAARVNGDLARSVQYLQRECIICMEKHPESRMVTMLNCQCRFCQDCISRQFSHVIHDQNIMKLVCPYCSEPKNLEDDAVATEYFNHLDILIRRCVDRETHDLFQRKLRDRTLMQNEPNFRWCSHCSSGFINEQPNMLKMACPNCRKYTCFKCKKEWEDQHEGITCEQFAAWKEANDPEAQANGLAEHLKRNGIECPNCKLRYDLAKGGCMHFKCTQCSHEFCSGCYQPFRHNENCPVSSNCARRGLHAHHPRDCLFYLRDRDPEELKKLLDDNNIEYDTEAPQRQAGEVQGAAAPDTGRCKVMEQRETSEAGLQDVECGKETPVGYAGLCKLHFSEYLVERINSNLIDPVAMFTIDDLRAELYRNDFEMPAKQNRQKDDDYLKQMIEYVQEKIPLPRKPPRRRILDVEDPLVPMAPAQAQELLVEDLEQEGGFADDIHFDASDSDSEDELSMSG